MFGQLSCYNVAIEIEMQVHFHTWQDMTAYFLKFLITLMKNADCYGSSWTLISSHADYSTRKSLFSNLAHFIFEITIYLTFNLILLYSVTWHILGYIMYSKDLNGLHLDLWRYTIVVIIIIIIIPLTWSL